jgi:hypothetical protein
VIFNIFSCLSRLLNVLSGGTPDMTLSARAHMDDLWIEKPIDAFFRVVLREHNHCEVWWWYEVERSKDVLSHPKAEVKSSQSGYDSASMYGK